MSTSIYAVTAAMVKRDTALDQVLNDDEWFGIKPLLIDILRACDQFDDPKFDATMLAETIVALVAGWATNGEDVFDDEAGEDPTS